VVALQNAQAAPCVGLHKVDASPHMVPSALVGVVDPPSQVEVVGGRVSPQPWPSLLAAHRRRHPLQWRVKCSVLSWCLLC
jgi:hypothetical protein